MRPIRLLRQTLGSYPRFELRSSLCASVLENNLVRAALALWGDVGDENAKITFT